MKKLILSLLAFAGLASAQISSLSLPHIIDSAAIPKVSYVDDNDNALKNRLNIVIDSVNADSVRTALQSFGSLRLTIDADANATGTCIAMTHNGAADTIAKFCDDLSARMYGTLAAASGTYSGTLGVTGAFTGTTGAFSSTLGATGLFTASGGISITGSGGSGAGRIYYDASVDGMVLRGNTGATNDFTLYSQNAGTLIANPTGTRNLTVGHSSGSVSVPGTMAVTGALTGAAGATLTGGPLIVGADATTQNIRINGPAATDRQIRFMTASSNRWLLGANSTAESGSSAGSDFTINARDDAGTSIDNPLTIARASGGAITLARPTTITGALTASSNLTQSAGVTTISVTDNTADAVDIQQGSNNYINVNTTNSSENVSLGNTTTNPTISLLGTGAKSISGAVSMGSTLAVTGAATFTAAPILSSATASLPLFTNGSNAVVSNAMTGTGSVVMSTSPTLVTPALGAATATSIVASGNVTADSLISSKFYEEGTFTGTLTGCTTSPTATLRYVRIGKQVTLLIPTLQATSNTAAATITGMPAGITPARNQWHLAVIEDNGVITPATPLGTGLIIQTSGVIQLWYNASASAFTTSGVKGIISGGTNGVFTYTLQ